MDIKNTIISAEVVIESLITLLKNEGVDISSIQFSIGNKEEGTKSENMSFESLIHLTLSWLKEAKAQAVPDLSELQERIAGHQYYHDEHGHMIVDMDDVVKEISGFDSCKAQAVPEWISVNDKLPPANILVLGMSQTRSNIFNIYNVMALDEFEEADVTHWMPLPDAPQEPAND